tara:strand:- start:467 stop:1351 length:885 start_codon:yes stop_codon:yes gene_type:complete
MGFAYNVLGFLLILASIPFAYAVHKLLQKEKALAFGQFLGPKTSWYSLAFLTSLLIIPYGLFAIVPVVFLLSIVSPAGRLDWSEHRNQRIVALSIVGMMIGIAGFVPVDSPRAPDEWGEPFANENPYAPAWPSSEQFTWIFVEPLNPTNFEIVQSLTLRTPHQSNPFLQTESSIWLSSVLGMQEERMRQAVDLVDERMPFRIDSESFRLQQKGDAESHTFRPESGEVELNVWVFDCYSTSGTDEDGTKVGEVVILGQSSWGGTLNLLVIVRPFFHDSLTTDPYSESIVNQWLVV